MPQPSTGREPSLLERAALSAATAWGFYLLAKFVNHRWYLNSILRQLQETEVGREPPA